jgi:L-ascorbate metabolism protein UlaG (beta-lactamase superfamily)
MEQNLRLDLPASSALGDAASNSAFFIGNATMLLRFAGFTILTDPTFVHMHEEVSLGYGMSAKRLTDPAVDIGQLPPIDFVLLSHFHGDHFDHVAERELGKDLPIVTTPQATKDLAKRGFRNTHGIDTWQTISIGKGDRSMRITACPGRHGPGVTDLVLPDVMGSLLEADTPPVGVTQRIYISGDTLVYDDLHEIPKRYPDIGLGVFHLGGTKVMGIMVTMDAEQGVEAVRIIDPQTVLPVHYDDYDVFTSSLDDFVAAAREAGLQDRVRPWRRGDTFDF